ncbi:hypothetical protein CR513_50036, partial [Mucuna pruriens]
MSEGVPYRKNGEVKPSQQQSKIKVMVIRKPNDNCMADQLHGIDSGETLHVFYPPQYVWEILSPYILKKKRKKKKKRRRRRRSRSKRRRQE